MEIFVHLRIKMRQTGLLNDRHFSVTKDYHDIHTIPDNSSPTLITISDRASVQT